MSIAMGIYSKINVFLMALMAYNLHDIKLIFKWIILIITEWQNKSSKSMLLISDLDYLY